MHTDKAFSLTNVSRSEGVRTWFKSQSFLGGSRNTSFVSVEGLQRKVYDGGYKSSITSRVKGLPGVLNT